ncbi:hypothetical protein M426DRAFT_317584 [Hypoxylon sp. CI-4A]|nr:hypothetical protein M426DRAFT_317584 [Hypoxylon sp. CI-4A]
MAGNHGAFPPAGPHRAQAPALPGVQPGAFRGGPIGQPPAPMYSQPIPPRVTPQGVIGRGPSVEISDVSRDLLTVEGMKEQLTEYAIFRFEKMPAQSRYDDEGSLQMPSWDRAIRARVSGISPRETARQMQRLNRETRTLTDKLKSLSPVLQRQIDAAQELLSSENPDPVNYDWVLVQLDHQLREILPYAPVSRGGLPPTRGHHSRRRPHSRTHGHSKKSYERISLTTFFKRAPKLNADVVMLYEAKKKRWPQNNHIAQTQIQPHLRPGVDSRPLPANVEPLGHGTSFGLNGGRGPSPIVSHPNRTGQADRGSPVNGGTIRPRGNNKGVAAKDDGHLESDSEFSEYSPSDDSLDTQTTPITSQSSGSAPNSRDHRRNHDEVRRPDQNTNTKHGQIPSKHTQYFSVKNGKGVPNTPRRRTSSGEFANDIDAYLAGIRHGAHFGPRPKPRINSAGRSPTSLRRRHTDDLEAGRDWHRGGFDDEISRLRRLSLDDGDDEDDEVVLRRTDSRRRREFDYLLQRGSVMDEDPFDRDLHSHPRYGRKRYQEPYVTDGSDSEYSLPRRSHGVLRR